MRTDTPKTIYLKDYKPPKYLAEHIDLTFKIFEEHTVVSAQTRYRKNHDGMEPLVLNAEHMKILSVKVDGEEIKDYQSDAHTLTIPCPGGAFVLETEVEIDPATNTRLEGLYKSGGNWCTQCEAEGFRSITPYIDRPDNMATFMVRIEADKKNCPVLLSNGNLIEEEDLPGDGTRHYALWHDPFPKPCYLFALVAGDLVHIEDTFMTCKRNEVLLRIYVRAGDEDQCAHAMDSLKRSMKWDEETFGRVYEYDRFNIVAVSDFNMGAMENTSLNIFNTALVLAHPELATDDDFGRVEGVIAHEYFHNWTGNRITCRDWFQLSLKEGFTVFRDQEFSSDMNSRDVQRIEDVVLLRRMQFAEDAGPLAHPIRPDNYIEINNFYTVTVYEKGAEVIRMQKELLGEEDFRKATDLYFDRHDGQAVTCDDFVQCMQDASGRDMNQFKLWYSQAGTPELTVETSYDEKTRNYTMTLSQHIPPTPGQKDKKPILIPVKVGLIGPNGDDMDEELLELTEETQDFIFEDMASKPVPSILRGFSAPVKLKTDLTDEDLHFLMVHDSDGFNRWEAGQTLALRMIGNMLDALEKGETPKTDEDFITSYGHILGHAEQTENEEEALLALALTLPSLPIIAQERKTVDPSAIYNVREQIIEDLRGRYAEQMEKLYHANHDTAFSGDFPARARRRLKNLMLRLLENEKLAKDQYDAACCMTDRIGALSILNDKQDSTLRNEAFSDFHSRFSEHLLVIDKWFAMQATSTRPQVLEDVRALRDHPDFVLTNPNRVRSLYAAFAMNNPVYFHDPSGAGYEFLTEAVIELNTVNPQIASRLLTPLREWRRYTADRQDKMKAALERIAKTPDLSPNVFEIVSKTL